MNKRSVSISDIELLSAYLDGQIYPRQLAGLEARIGKEPSLSKELDKLQKTRQMVRSLPRLRAPRNFTLSAQVNPRHSPTRLPALFGAVSALSSALLILLVIGNLVLTGTPTQPVSMAVEESAAYPVMMEASAPVEDNAETLQAKIPGETEQVLSLEAPVEETSRIAEPTPEYSLAVPPSEAILPTATPVLEEILALGVQETFTPTPDLLSQSTLRASPTPLPDAVALPDVTGEGSGGEALPKTASENAVEATPVTDTPTRTTTLLTGELVLGGIALLSGLIALFLLIRLKK